MANFRHAGLWVHFSVWKINYLVTHVRVWSIIETSNNPAHTQSVRLQNVELGHHTEEE